MSNLTEEFALMEATLEDICNQERFPGLTTVIVQDQTVVWEYSFGVADIGSERPVKPSTVFGLG